MSNPGQHALDSVQSRRRCAPLPDQAWQKNKASVVAAAHCLQCGEWRVGSPCRAYDRLHQAQILAWSLALPVSGVENPLAVLESRSRDWRYAVPQSAGARMFRRLREPQLSASCHATARIASQLVWLVLASAPGLKRERRRYEWPAAVRLWEAEMRVFCRYRSGRLQADLFR